MPSRKRDPWKPPKYSSTELAARKLLTNSIFLAIEDANCCSTARLIRAKDLQAAVGSLFMDQTFWRELAGLEVRSRAICLLKKRLLEPPRHRKKGLK